MLADVDPDALVRIGLDGIIGEQPIPVQTQIFGVFDRCVSPERYAEVLGPVLVIAGADDDGASCVFETMRATLGFAGMYRVAAGETGELDRDETLLDAVGRIYDGCDVDPSLLAPPTTPPPPPTSAPPVHPAGAEHVGAAVDPADHVAGPGDDHDDDGAVVGSSRFTHLRRGNRHRRGSSRPSWPGTSPTATRRTTVRRRSSR